MEEGEGHDETRDVVWGEGRRHGSRHRARNGHEAELIAALVDASRQRAGHKAELIDALVDSSRGKGPATRWS
jgi:hypothetical protein